MPGTTYDTVVEAIYRAGIEPGSWPQALEHLASHVGALGGLIAYHAPVAGEEFMVVGGLRQDLADLYLTKYPDNAYSAAMLHAQPGIIYNSEQLADHRAVQKTAFHADILAPQSIRSLLLIAHPSLMRPGATGGIALPLDRRQADKIESATQYMSRLVPHLMRSLELNLQIGRHRADLRHLEYLLDSLPGAALLLNRDGTIGTVNRAAETLLAAADGLSVIRNGEELRLTAANAYERKSLALRITQAVRFADGGEGELGGVLRITRVSGRPPLILLLIPLPPPSFSLYAAVDTGHRVLVQIMDPQLPVDAQAEHLATAVGLTEAETRVAALIGCGLTAPEAAKALGLSLATVKTHLAHCFDKTGVHSQTALAHLVASISSATRPFKVGK